MVANQLAHRLFSFLLRRLFLFDAALLQQAADVRDDDFAIDVVVLAVLEPFEHFAQSVERLKNDLNHFRRNRQLAVARRVEDVFDLVRQGVDVIQAQHAGEALERMGRAEHIVQQAGVKAIGAVGSLHLLVELQQVFVEPTDVLVGFVEKIGEHVREELVSNLCIVAAHGSFLVSRLCVAPRFAIQPRFDLGQIVN